MSNEPRWDLIRRLRKQIAENNYVTEDKLRTTAERLTSVLSSSPHDEGQMDGHKPRPDLDL